MEREEPQLDYDLYKPDTCPNCGVNGEHIIFDSRIPALICQNCGYVMQGMNYVVAIGFSKQYSPAREKERRRKFEERVRKVSSKRRETVRDFIRMIYDAYINVVKKYYSKARSIISQHNNPLRIINVWVQRIEKKYSSFLETTDEGVKEEVLLNFIAFLEVEANASHTLIEALLRQVKRVYYLDTNKLKKISKARLERTLEKVDILLKSLDEGEGVLFAKLLLFVFAFCPRKRQVVMKDRVFYKFIEGKLRVKDRSLKEFLRFLKSWFDEDKLFMLWCYDEDCFRFVCYNLLGFYKVKVYRLRKRFKRKLISSSIHSLMLKPVPTP